MREKKLAMRASGSDRVSEELLTMTLHRQVSLVDDPTSTLCFGWINLDRAGDGGAAVGARFGRRDRSGLDVALLGEALRAAGVEHGTLRSDHRTSTTRSASWNPRRSPPGSPMPGPGGGGSTSC